MNRFSWVYIVLLGWIGLSSCTKDEGTFVLMNRSSETISNLSLSISGKTFAFKNVRPGDSVSGEYLIKSDDHYVIAIEFASGKKMKKEDGYVTHGMDFQHEITVTESDVIIKMN